jgi:hypothetical protein
MNNSNQTAFPKLRVVDPRPILHDGQPLLLLRDPLQLTEKTLLMPHALVPVLALCDGTREDARALSASLALRFGLTLDHRVIDQLLAALDEVLLLDNDNYARARAEALEEYRNAPFRPPACAGRVYPQDPGELRLLLDAFVTSTDSDHIESFSGGRGLISPHIDYARGGAVYARVWKQAEVSINEADLVVLLGTDHYGGEGRLSLTRQNYATPFGVLPTARNVVDEIARAIGEEAAFAGEMSHRGEHSIELASVWLHYIRQERAVELVPILCGSFADFIHTGDDPESDSTIAALIETLRRATSGRKVMVVAAADLAHIGPAFGGEPVDMEARAKLAETDDDLIAHCCAGDWRGFLETIRRVEDSNNVCGVSPIYLALRLLGGAAGARVAYEGCPADADNTSLVSVCGVVLR